MSNVTNKKPGGTTSFSGNPAPSSVPANQFNARTATATTTSPAPSGAEVKLTHDAIARAAYLRWQKQGGDAHTNWVEAERELRAAAAAANPSQRK
ncbi:MAG: DUF2934 domain-containing protein [Phycisphaerales bacterium]